MIKDAFGKQNVEITRSEEFKSDKTLSSTRADLVLRTPGHKKQLAELRDWMLSRKSAYSRYF